MPRANELKAAATIRAKLPTKQHPYLKKLIHELDFACSTCSAAKGQPIYRTFAEVLEAGVAQPISGPRNFTTRWGLLCPECYTTPNEGPFIDNGIIDLLTVPPTYKRPKRASGGTNESFFEDEDEDDADAPVLRTSTAGPQKKTSDLNPKTRGKKTKGKGFSSAKAKLKKKTKAKKAGLEDQQ